MQIQAKDGYVNHVEQLQIYGKSSVIIVIE